jgi:hypothetical protein
MKEMKDGMRGGIKDVDDDLRHALRREEPPAGFAERVLRRVAEPPQAEQRARTLPFIQWAAAAALVAAMAGGINYVAKQKERAEGEAAKERVMLALHIAGSKLQLVQTRISRMHEPPAKNSNQ